MSKHQRLSGVFVFGRFSMTKIHIFLGYAAVLMLGASAQAATPIGAVQGAIEKSPLAGQSVTIQGVVTGDFQAENQLNGFFVQDGGDNDPRTSDGLFVYTSPRRANKVEVRPGDVVSVTGRVEEFSGMTQIGTTTQIVVQNNGAVPMPLPLTLPLPPDVDAERYEGMLVTIPQTLTITGNYDLQRYGTLTLSANGRLIVPGNVGGDAAQEMAMTQANARRTLLLDDGNAKQNPQPKPYLNAAGTRRAGDTIQGLTGIFSFGWGAYRLQPTIAPRFIETNPRPAAPPQIGGDLRVMSFNLRNYFTTMKRSSNQARGASSPAEFARQTAKLLATVRAADPDLLAAIEVENNGDVTVLDFLSKLNAVSNNAYAAVLQPKTGMGKDEIRVAIFYKPAKLTPRGASRSDVSAIFNRPPLAQTFATKNGVVFTTIVNHFKSKGSCPDAGDVDKGEGCWNVLRTAQSMQLLKFIEQLRQEANSPDILAIGDFNANTNEAPLRVLRGGGLIQAGGTAPERYSFVFGGQAGALDHAFVTPTFAPLITEVAEWHINADEPLLAEDVPGFYRSSDHDPLLLGLKLTPN